MKVLQINSFFSVGGPPRIVKGIYDILVENGHECVLAASREHPIEGMKIIKIGSLFSNYWHLLMSRVFDSQGLSSKHATKKLIKSINKYDPDVIHLHNLHGYYLNYEILFDYLRYFNKPIIWTLHDCWPITGHCVHFDYLGCEKWKTGCYNCPQKREYPRCDLADRSERNYSKKKAAFTGIRNMAIVTPSNWLAEIVKQSFLREYPVKVINNGIDLDVFMPINPKENDFKERYCIIDKTILLGVAQNWSKKKGFVDFIKLSKLLDDKYQIVMVGLTKKLFKITPPNIIGIAKTNNVNELIKIYSAADMFINTTYEDTFPTVNLEALACGIPVITYQTGGSPECVEEDCGAIIEKGNIAEIFEAVCKAGMLNFSKENCCRRAQKFDKYEKYIEYIYIYKDNI